MIRGLGWSAGCVAIGALCAALSGCGMPPAKPPAEAAAQPEAPVVLLGAVEAPAGEETVSPAGPVAVARRPGWGTMAPIPNPEDQFADRRSAPYRLVGPTVPEQSYAAEKPRRLSREVRQMAAVRPPASAKPRVRHWIVPIADRRTAPLGGE